MTSPYSTIKDNVYLLLVNSSTINNFSEYIAYVSSVTTPGKIITICDVGGYVSSTRKLIVSTMTGNYFSDGSSSIPIVQQFGYVTLESKNRSTFDIINICSFPNPSNLVYISSLNINDGLTFNSGIIQSYVSSQSINSSNVLSFNVYSSNVSSATVNTNILSTNIGNINNLNVINTNTNILATNFTSTFNISSILTYISTTSSINITSSNIITNVLNSSNISSVNTYANTVNSDNAKINSIFASNVFITSLSSYSIASSNINSYSINVSSFDTQRLNIKQINTSSILLSTNNVGGYITISQNGSNLYFNNATPLIYPSTASNTLNMNNYAISNVNDIYTSNMYIQISNSSTITINANLNMNNNSIVNINNLSSQSGFIGGIIISTNYLYNIIPSYNSNNQAIDIISASPQRFVNCLQGSIPFNSTFNSSFTTSNEYNIIIVPNPSVQKLWKIRYTFNGNINSSNNISLYFTLSNTTTSKEYMFDTYNSNRPIIPILSSVFLPPATGRPFFFSINGIDTISMDVNQINNIYLNVYVKKGITNNFVSFAPITTVQYYANYSFYYSEPLTYNRFKTYNFSAYGNNIWLTGESSNLYTSRDTDIWNNSSGCGMITNCGTYGNNKWVIGGISVSNKSLCYSVDNAKTFNVCSNQPYISSVNGVAYGNGVYVATGTAPSSLVYSLDAVNWRNVSGTIFKGTGNDIKFYNNNFIAVGSDSNNPVLASSDGISWSSASISTSIFNNSNIARCITYGYGRWFIGGDKYLVVSSNNGLNWSIANSTYFINTSITTLSMGDTLFVNTLTQINSNYFHTSSNYGSNWIVNASGFLYDFTNCKSITNADGKYLVVGSGAYGKGIVKISVPNIVSYTLEPLSSQL